MAKSDLWRVDFHAWASEQSALLRAGRLAEIDRVRLAEEVETMGRVEKRELVNRLTILLAHLLKWSHQPSLRGNSWRLTIKEQRLQIADHLDDNPSLAAFLDDAMRSAWARARLEAARETGHDEDTFARECPWAFARVISETFWPDERE